MASIKLDTNPVTGKRYNFELAAAHLLPYDPVAKKRSSQKRGVGDISDTTAADISSFGAKEGIGATGVHLRYHTDVEYKDLSEEQQDELRAWCLTPEGKKRSKCGKGGSKGIHQRGGSGVHHGSTWRHETYSSPSAACRRDAQEHHGQGQESSLT